jgi:two-component system, response regulator
MHTILLVEDNPDDETLALRALTQNKIANQVDVARDGVEAIAYLFGTDGEPARPLPQVVLLDLNLPRIDGLEVLRRIRDAAHMRFLPVVILTSSNEERDLVESYSLGANSYILKPVDFQQFTDAVGQLGMYWLVLNRTPGRSI